MTFEEALRDIKSYEFAARVGIASGLRNFVRVAADQESVRAVIDEMGSKDKRQRVLFEILRLSRLEVDFRYENPWDSALAVLLWLLNVKDPSLAQLAAEAVAQARQCWWALRMADRVLRQSLLRDTQASEQAHHVAISVTPSPNLQNSNAGENLLLSGIAHRLPLDAVIYASFGMDRPHDQQAPLNWPREYGYVADLNSRGAVAWLP